MDTILTSFLHEKELNASNLSKDLKEQQDEMIASFGGLTNMIELCLTNPIASEYINIHSKQFNSFKKVLKIPINHTTDDVKNPTSTRVTYSVNNSNNNSDDDSTEKTLYQINHNSNYNTNTLETNQMTKKNTPKNENNTMLAVEKCDTNLNITRIMSVESTDIGATIDTMSSSNLTSIDGLENNENNNNNAGIIKDIHIVNTVKEYNNSTLIINCNPKNNFLFKLVKNKQTSLNLYQNILTKRLFFAVTFLWFIFTCLGSLRNFDFIERSNSTSIKLMFISFQAIGSIIVGLYCISVILIVNITVMNLVTHTFDFWFKVCNILIGFIALWIIMIGSESSDMNDNEDSSSGGIFSSYNKKEFVAQIISHICFFLVGIVLFLLDSLPITINVKRIAICLFVLFEIFYTLEMYFFSKDFEWNPFDLKYSLISFKSILLSTCINLIVFIIKPMITDTKRWFKKLIFGNKKKDNYDINDHVRQLDLIKARVYNQRCATVYKRPFIKWKQID